MTALDLLASLRSGAWLDAQEFPPLEFAVPGIIPEGLTLHVGPPKIGKSWMVLAHGLALASGGITLSAIKVGPPRPVLYLALEDSDRRLQDRCRKLLGREPIPALLDYLTRVELGQVLATIAAWLTLHGTRQPLVILDTLGKVMPPAIQGESAYQRDYRVASALKDLADAHPGTAMLVNHHDRKASSDDFVDTVSGTNGLAGAADTILVLTRDRNDTAGVLKVTGRDVPEGEYALRFQDGHDWQLDGDDLAEAAQRARDTRATTGLGDRSAEVIRFVGRNPQGATAAQVAEELDLEQNAARAYLSRLVDSGRLSKPRRGLYAPVASVASVANEGGGPPERNTRNGSATLPGEDESVPGSDGWRSESPMRHASSAARDLPTVTRPGGRSICSVTGLRGWPDDRPRIARRQGRQAPRRRPADRPPGRRGPGARPLPGRLHPRVAPRLVEGPVGLPVPCRPVRRLLRAPPRAPPGRPEPARTSPPA